MKTRCSGWAPSGIHRGSIMQSRTRMLAEMPTLTSRAAITCTIKRCQAGTSQQVLAHQTSSALTVLYPTFWDKIMSALSNPLPGKEIVRTVADRRAAGRSLRKEVPRSSHAEWSPASDRPDQTAGGTEPFPASTTRADPLQSHGRLSLWLSARRGSGYGPGPCSDACYRAASPGLRRRSSQQLWRLCYPGTESGFRCE